MLPPPTTSTPRNPSSLWPVLQIILSLITLITLVSLVILQHSILKSASIDRTMLTQPPSQRNPLATTTTNTHSTNTNTIHPLSTRPIRVPTHSEFDYQLTDDGSASQPMPSPPRIVSQQHTNGTHHTRFSQVCLKIGADETKTLLFFHLDQDARARFDRDYWSRNSVHWRLYHDYLDEEQSRLFPLPGSLYLPGSTFFYTLAVDNIAQYYQELVCHLPPMIDAEYQRHHLLSGYDHLFTLHMKVLDANGTHPRDWCESQLRLVGDTMQALQPQRPIHLMDQQVWTRYGQPREMCFDELVVYQPASCQWASEVSPYPASLKAGHESHLKRVFTTQRLRTQTPCLHNITIYSRMDAPRRRLLNADELVSYFELRIAALRLDAVVRLIDHIQGDLFAQMRLFNSADVVVAPHSASAYNAMWLPTNGLYLEIGLHGSWYEFGTAPLAQQTFRSFNDKRWFVVPPFNASFDNHPHEAERSFYGTPELFRVLFDAAMNATTPFCR